MLATYFLNGSINKCSAVLLVSIIFFFTLTAKNAILVEEQRLMFMTNKILFSNEQEVMRSLEQ